VRQSEKGQRSSKNEKKRSTIVSTKLIVVGNIVRDKNKISKMRKKVV
jgi:hypothetical protein